MEDKINKMDQVPGADFGEEVRSGISRLIENIKKVIYIPRNKLEYLLAAKLAGGHVILADAHGVGKTSLARALAGSISWNNTDKDSIMETFSRIQCTVDLLPQDILGYNRLDGTSRHMIFVKGPIFAHFVLCDEINLLTPKTQGGFFQAMEEQMVSIEGRNYDLGSPYFIIATMNLKGVHLFPLPAPQLDRFMIQLSLGFPEKEMEIEIVKKHGRLDAWKDFSAVISMTELQKWQSYVDNISIHPDIVQYIVACVQATRNEPEVLMGASPRTGVKLSRLVRALALLRGQDFVTIDLVKEVFFICLAHRLVLQDSSQNAESILERILNKVPVKMP